MCRDDNLPGNLHVSRNTHVSWPSHVRRHCKLSGIGNLRAASHLRGCRDVRWITDVWRRGRHMRRSKYLPGYRDVPGGDLRGISHLYGNHNLRVERHVRHDRDLPWHALVRRNNDLSRYYNLH